MSRRTLFTRPGLFNPLLAPPPNVPIEIDWDHPLANGLITLFVAGQGLRELTGFGAPLIGTAERGLPTYVAGPNGVEFGFQTGGYATTANAAQTNASAAVSLYAFGRYAGATTSTSNSPPIIAVAPNSTSASPYLMYELGISSTGASYAFSGQGSTYNSISGSSPLVANTPYSLVATIANPGLMQIWQNAVSVASQTFTLSKPTTNGTPQFLLGTHSTVAQYTGFNANIAGIYNRILTAQEVAWLAVEPFAVIRRKMLRGYYFASSGLAITLTGVSGTGSLGTLSAGSSTALAGVTGSGSLGTLNTSQAAALGQVASTGAVGSLGPSSALTLAQNATTGSLGALTAGTAFTLFGVGGTGQIGTLGIVHMVTLPGVSATGTVGTLAPAASVAITGVTGTGSLGSLHTSLTVPLSGVAGVGTLGTLTASQGNNVAVTLTGVVGVGSLGRLSAATSVALSGVSATGSVGSLAGSLSVALAGVQATGSLGTLASATSVALLGVSGVGSLGYFVPSLGLSLTGVTGSGSLGRFSLGSITLYVNPLAIIRATINSVVTAAPLSSVVRATVTSIVSARSAIMARSADLTPIDVGETRTITFDFAGALGTGETLTGSPSVLCTVSSGTDGEASSRLIGSPAIGPSPSTGVAAMAVLQQVGTMTAGVTYALQCLASAAPDTPSLWARVACVQPN